MPHDRTARLVARTKALGLVAATAAVTAALAGGGVVAVTVVGNEKPVTPSTAIPGEQRSDTATATIADKPAKPDRPAVDTPECGDADNHGAFVSGVARTAEPGPSHGPLVAAAAQGDCGKPADAGTGRPDSPGKSAGNGRSGDAGPPEGKGPPEGRGAGRPDSPGNS